MRIHLAASRAEMIQRQHKIAKTIQLEVGDYVMIKDLERISKLAPKFSGPYTVLSKEHSNKFKLFNLATASTEIVHVDRLKKVSHDLLQGTETVTSQTNDS